MQSVRVCTNGSLGANEDIHRWRYSHVLLCPYLSPLFLSILPSFQSLRSTTLLEAAWHFAVAALFATIWRSVALFASLELFKKQSCAGKNASCPVIRYVIQIRSSVLFDESVDTATAEANHASWFVSRHETLLTLLPIDRGTGSLLQRIIMAGKPLAIRTLSREASSIECVCGGGGYSEAIGCDDPGCKKEWFHLSCMDLEESPEGEWYCPKLQSLKIYEASKLRRDF